MSSIEQSFHIAPTHRVEQRVNRVVDKDTSIIGVLGRYSSYITERMRTDEKSAYPLIVRLAEMDIVAGLEIVCDDTDLLLDVLSNERVILKNHQAIKGLVAQSKQIAKDHSIVPSDMRLQKIAEISRKMETMSGQGYQAPPFHQEFPQLSSQDSAIVNELDEVYKEFLSKRRLEAPRLRALTLEDETHQYLRMYLDKYEGKKTVIEPEYQLKWLNVQWEARLMRSLNMLYGGDKIITKDNGKIYIDNVPVDEMLKNIDTEPKTMYDMHKAELIATDGDGYFYKKLHVNELAQLTIKAYEKDDPSWVGRLKELVGYARDVSSGFFYNNFFSTLLDCAYKKNDLSTCDALFQESSQLCSEHFIAVEMYKNGDQRWKNAFNQIAFQKTWEKNRLLLAFSLYSIQLKNEDYMSFFNQINDLQLGSTIDENLIANCIITAYQSDNDQAFQESLRWIIGKRDEESPKKEIFEMLILEAYKKGKPYPYNDFLKKISFQDKMYVKAEMYYIDGKKKGEYEKALTFIKENLSSFRGYLPLDIFGRIAEDAYEADDKQTIEDMLQQLVENNRHGQGEVISRKTIQNIGFKAFKRGDKQYKDFIQRLDLYEKVKVLQDIYMYNLDQIEASHAYMLYQLTDVSDDTSIVDYFNSLPKKPYQPYNMSPIHAGMINKILHDNPEQFIEIVSGVSYSFSEFSADTLVKNIFGKELFAHLCEKDRSWARSGYDSSLLDQAFSDISVEKYLMYSDSDSLEGGDPRGEPHPVMRTNIPLGAFLTTRRLANINEYGTGETAPIIFDPSINDKDNTQYTVSYIPRLKRGIASLAVSPNSAIQELSVDDVSQDTPSSNQYEIISDDGQLSYTTVKNSFPDMPLVSYAEGATLSEELSRVKLPYELEALVENIREQSLTHQIATIQELRDQYFIYDPDNKRVASLKTGKSIRQRLSIMRKRAEEIKKENPDNKTFESMRWAGVCSDITFISATLLAKLNVPFYIDMGFLVNDPVVTTQETHSQIIIPLADEEGKRHDLEFDPTNGIVRIGNVKITPEQLREIIPVDNPTQPASIEPKRTGQNEFFAPQSLRHSTHEQRKNCKEQELYTKIAAVGESLGGSSVLRHDEKWSPSVINRLDSIQRYFLSQIVKDVQTTHPEGVKDIITHALSYIRKRGGTINREELKQIISTDKNFSFLIE